MKKTLIFILSLLLITTLFSSCKKSDNADFFDYQNKSIDLTLGISYNGSESSAKLKMSAPGEDGSRNELSLEYLTPDTVCGYRIEKKEDGYFGIMGGVEIPFGENGGIMRLIEFAFSLSEDMINSISATPEGLTAAGISFEGYNGCVTLNSDGALHSIDLTDTDGNSLSLTVGQQ